MKPTLNVILAVILLVAGNSCSSDESTPEVIKSNAKQITGFVFLASENNELEDDITGTINESNRTVNASFPSGTVVTSLTPDISVSAKASVHPTGLQDFTDPVQFTVTAEDGTTTIYTASISVLPPDATLEGIEPDNGPKGTMVTLTGDNFGEDANKVKVYFNDIEAAISDLTNTSIIAEVPPRAYSGVVKVIIDDLELIGPSFSYTVTDIIVTTFVGSPTPGSADGLGTNAQFKAPLGLEFDSEGTLYVADPINCRIRKVTPDGMVSTFAGTTPGFADGAGDVAQFRAPSNIAFDENGNMYVTDSENQRIRKISPDGNVSTLAGSTQGNNDGPGDTARFILPHGIILDSDNNLVVTDNNDRIRKITLDGVVSTFAGSTEGFVDGTGTSAKFNVPLGIIADVNNTLYVADWNNHKIRKISKSAEVSTLAGSIEGFLDGPAEQAQFQEPVGIAIDSQGIIYVADSRNHRIRKITPEGVVSTLAGSTEGYSDGPADNAQFSIPGGIVVDAHGTIYVADQGNNCIRKIIQE